MASQKNLLLGLLIFGLLHSGLANPQHQKSYDDEYQSDYAEDYNDDDEPSPSFSTPDPPTVEVTDFKETVKEGDNVILHCDVKNVGDTVIMWYNGSQLLSQKLIKLTRDPRVTLLSQTQLEIKNVTLEDSNVYLCKIVVQKPIHVEITLEVQRNRNMSVKIWHKGNDVSLRTVTYEPDSHHSPLVLECRVEDDEPKASIVWTNDGNLLKHSPKNDVTIKNGVLTFLKPRKHHSGTYQCFADNKVGTPAISSVELHIKHHPVFAKHHDYVNTAEGLNAHLQCSYTADPQPTSVRWFKHEPKQRLHQNDKYDMMNDYHDKHNRSVLVIKNVQRMDLVDYHCEVENSIGKQSETITLGLVPAAAHFHEYKYMKHKLFTTWVVKSVQPLQELQVFYKKKDTVKTAVAADVVTAAECHHGECKIEGSIELQPGEWIISAKAQNTEGWAQAESIMHTIKIPDDVVENSNASSKLAQISLVTLIIASLCSLIRNN